jgi:hypothetical protein
MKIKLNRTNHFNQMNHSSDHFRNITEQQVVGRKGATTASWGEI